MTALLNPNSLIITLLIHVNLISRADIADSSIITIGTSVSFMVLYPALGMTQTVMEDVTAFSIMFWRTEAGWVEFPRTLLTLNLCPRRAW